jgi:hypothetical protein
MTSKRKKFLLFLGKIRRLNFFSYKKNDSAKETPLAETVVAKDSAKASREPIIPQSDIIDGSEPLTRKQKI